MASDEDYSAFLDKANEDTGASSKKKGGGGGVGEAVKGGFTARTVNAGEVPRALRELDEVYVSEADEEFEGVSLGFAGEGKLDAASFAKTISRPENKVEALAPKEFDPKGRYGSVLEKVGEAAGCGRSGVRVFRVGGEGARVEYWVVALEEDGGRVVGVRAKAVES